MHFRRLPSTEHARRYFRPVTDMALADLTALQTDSYRWFFEQSLRELFDEVSPITDFTGRDLELSFHEYFIDEPKFDEKTCRIKNITFEAPLRVRTMLTNKRTGEVKEQEVYLCDLPLMTERGTFMINGVERVVVSQIIRSPGAFFTAESQRGRRYYGAKIIPNRGAWIEIETDLNNVLWVKVDRKRKAPVTTLLRAFGYSTDESLHALLDEVDTHPQIKYAQNAIAKDPAHSQEEGFVEIYRRIRPGDLATVDNARSLVEAMFFNFDRYDLGPVGRYKFRERFGIKDASVSVEAKEARILTKEDLGMIAREVIRLNVSQEEPDDIDHLGNRRIKAVGELVQSRFRVGLTRMERIVKDRMSTLDVSSLAPSKLINARPVIGAIREFFMSSQLSQFMDQTNPLAELEHKRRISAMGPGGLARDRAGFEVRDVHPTHYGRICPIATPEGPNIGLVGHLASYARVNHYGFIETPYRVVAHDEGRARVTDTVVYLNAFEENKATITSSTVSTDEGGYFTAPRVEARRHGEPALVPIEEVTHTDVSSKQVISVATALIPFLEHDDGNRALMGTNMQRQAVPLVRPESPLVGTGVEERAARDSGHVIVAGHDGEVIEADGAHIVLEGDDGVRTRYELNKFLRSNASTCLNQRVITEKGARVSSGTLLADGPATDKGDLALGRNVLVAFMVWDGYNYEDAVIVSERLVREDYFSSIHIEHRTIDVRETKLGPEVITSDIPNVSEEKLRNLDAEGVIRVGAEVSSGDILVGKITPKGETELSAEERLLRAIFGEKARDVRDTSLYLEHGEHGKVVDVKTFSTEEGDKLSPGVVKSVQISIADMRKVQVGDKMAGRHGNKGVISKIVPIEDMPMLEDGTPVDIILSPLGVISRMNLGQLLETHLGLAANALGYRVATPVFCGLTEHDIKEELKRAGFPADGQVTLLDGRAGEPFDHKVTVGYVYMLKLVHMVEDKIHQRSIGPYSLITQQPMGGKAQFGGQRFGEMEVWALEAYGAAYTLQEVLTIKSDDVPGRSKAFESIIKGEPIVRRNVPESFQVLTRELKALCLDVELLVRGAKGELEPVRKRAPGGENDEPTLMRERIRS